MSTIVGRRVKDRRNELDLTQEDLTRLVQDLTGGMLRRPNLSKIENDNYGEAGAWVVVALSKALRTSPDYLLGFTDDPTPNADPDAILRSMDEQDRAIVRRLGFHLSRLLRRAVPPIQQGAIRNNQRRVCA